MNIEEDNIKQEKLGLEWDLPTEESHPIPEESDTVSPNPAVSPITEVFDQFTQQDDKLEVGNTTELKTPPEPATAKDESVQLSNGTIPQEESRKTYPLKTDLSTAVPKPKNPVLEPEDKVLVEAPKPVTATEEKTPEKPVEKTKAASIFRKAEEPVTNLSHSIGKTLQNARKGKELTTEDVAEKTRISREIIEKIEKDDFSSTPAPVYTRGYVKKLAELYEIDTEKVVAKYNEMISGERRKKPVVSAKKETPKIIDDLAEPESTLVPAGVQPSVVSHQKSGGMLKKIAIALVCIISIYIIQDLISGREDETAEQEKPEQTVSTTKPAIEIKDLVRYTKPSEIKTIKLKVPKTELK